MLCPAQPLTVPPQPFIRIYRVAVDPLIEYNILRQRDVAVRECFVEGPFPIRIRPERQECLDAVDVTFPYCRLKLLHAPERSPRPPRPHGEHRQCAEDDRDAEQPALHFLSFAFSASSFLTIFTSSGQVEGGCAVSVFYVRIGCAYHKLTLQQL